MRTAPYLDALTAASVLWSGKTSPDATTAAQLNLFLNRRAVQFWEQFPWPEWTVTERRTFAPIYSPAVLNETPEVVYYPPADGHYQSLTTGLAAPASGSAVNTGGTLWTANSLNKVRVYAWQTVGSGRIYSADYLEISYTQLPDPHSSLGIQWSWTAVTGADGYRLLRYSVEQGWDFNVGWDVTATTYEDQNEESWDTSTFTVTPKNTAPTDADGLVDYARWALVGCGESATDWDAAETGYVVGDQVTNPSTLRIFQALATVPVAIEPGVTDGWETYWGEIFPFHRVIELEQAGETSIGECFQVYPSDPRCCGRPTPLHFELIAEGILVPCGPNVVWLRFRLRAPSWSGTPWNLDTTYALDDQVWSSTEGDFFKSLQAANANHAVTDADWWGRVEFPYVLRDAAAQAAYADMLLMDGQNDKFALQSAEAMRLLRREFDKLERQQGQTRPLPVRQRC